MNRTAKEILRHVADGKLQKASDIAEKAGYMLEWWDGDGETGPLPPELMGVYSPKQWADEVERRMMEEVRKNY